MKSRVTLWLIGYGSFLIAAGVGGYLLTKESSTSAIVNGVFFGSLMVLMGIFHQHGRPWTLPASLTATAVFTLTFFWRGAVQWIEVSHGVQDRLPVAALLTVMAAMSLFVMLKVLRSYRH